MSVFSRRWFALISNTVLFSLLWGLTVDVVFNVPILFFIGLIACFFIPYLFEISIIGLSVWAIILMFGSDIYPFYIVVLTLVIIYIIINVRYFSKGGYLGAMTREIVTIYKIITTERRYLGTDPFYATAVSFLSKKISKGEISLSKIREMTEALELEYEYFSTAVSAVSSEQTDDYITKLTFLITRIEELTFNVLNKRNSDAQMTMLETMQTEMLKTLLLPIPNHSYSRAIKKIYSGAIYIV